MKVFVGHNESTDYGKSDAGSFRAWGLLAEGQGNLDTAISIFNKQPSLRTQ
jgi:hypothetical protein